MPEYWIQLHDYSSTSYENVSPHQAKLAFHTYDWNSELDRYDEDDPDKNCPPGIGISNGIPLTEAGAILLHVCPVDDYSVFMSIHCTIEKSFLGLFRRSKQIVNYIDPYERSQVDPLIDYVFSGDHRSLLAVRK